MFLTSVFLSLSHSFSLSLKSITYPWVGIKKKRGGGDKILARPPPSPSWGSQNLAHLSLLHNFSGLELCGILTSTRKKQQTNKQDNKKDPHTHGMLSELIKQGSDIVKSMSLRICRTSLCPTQENTQVPHLSEPCFNTKEGCDQPPRGCCEEQMKQIKENAWFLQC